MTQWSKPVLLVLLLLAPFGVRAEVAYVSGGVNLGVHQEPSLTSTIVTLVPPGTSLEVLEQRDGLARVRLGDGTEGWVDGRYLSETISPSEKADGLEAELVQTATELARARERAAELEYQLNREKERARIMEADILKARKGFESKLANSGNTAAASADALRKTTEENLRMKKRIAELESKLNAIASGSGETPVVIVERASASDDEASLISRYTAITRWQIWQVMLLLFGLLLAFAAGGYVVDWEVRRRHGGFRV